MSQTAFLWVLKLDSWTPPEFRFNWGWAQAPAAEATASCDSGPRLAVHLERLCLAASVLGVLANFPFHV